MEFILGCNYWASNAGADMWRNFDITAVEKDLSALSEYGIKYMRVFPNWRDFQPVEPLITGGGRISGYTVKGKSKADNPYYLDEAVMERFSQFLDVCEKHGIKLIVGLITGWMSGGLFIPTALYGEDIITSPKAHYFQQLFIKGFVSRFKKRDIIYAWDLGNECNCMSYNTDRWQAASWTAMISCAIKAEDPTRAVVSGMHSLSVTDGWTIEDQAEFTDILTTHPYPFWCEFTRIDEALSIRTTMHPTAQSKYYAELGGKPCLAEEIGTMGPMICSDEAAADFMRLNMLSLWANGASGVMWWCANDQSRLTTYPYTEQMVEQELGMLTNAHEPKPVLKEVKRFSELLDSLGELSPATVDAVCILSRDQKQWGVAYMTYILSRKAGMNCSFAYADGELPDSKLYLLPSVNGVTVMHKSRYESLKQRVYDGADLYISLDNAVLSGFNELTGLKVTDSYEYHEGGMSELDGIAFSFTRTRNVLTEAAGAEILAVDNEGRPFISVNRYGKGRVFYVNAPIEAELINRHNAFDGNTHLIYRRLFAEHINNKPVLVTGDALAVTYHPTDDGCTVVAINHYGEEKPFEAIPSEGYTVDKVIYGENGTVKPYDACIFKLRKTTNGK